MFLIHNCMHLIIFLVILHCVVVVYACPTHWAHRYGSIGFVHILILLLLLFYTLLCTYSLIYRIIFVIGFLYYMLCNLY